MASSSLLLDLPAELRLKIYTYILAPEHNAVTFQDGYMAYDFKDALVLYNLNRQIYQESRKIFRDLNNFILIRTPWAHTMTYVVHRQRVPVVVTDEDIDTFRISNMTVVIDAPHYPQDEAKVSQFVIHLRDLPRFAEQWYYADLSFTLNHNLAVDLELHAPYTPIYEEKHVPKSLQRRLLLPFAQVKRLARFEVKGEVRPFASLMQELRDLQSIPLKSPEQCLREASKAKADGIVEFQAGHFEAALEQYQKAWSAMHIVIEGNSRHVYGDHHFGQTMKEEPYKDKNGQAVRMLLRVELVAATCLAYLKLNEYEQCKFWGERSISMLREATGMGENEQRSPEDEVIAEFPQFGYIYEYTAAACKALGEPAKAKRLYQVARGYLRGEGERIEKEIETCSA